MKYVDYNNQTGEIKGFYDKDIHGDKIPKTAIQITDEIWQELLNNQSKYVVDIAKITSITGVVDSIDELFANAPTPTAQTPQPTQQEILNAKLLKDNADMQIELDKQKQLNADLLLKVAKLGGSANV